MNGNQRSLLTAGEVASIKAAMAQVETEKAKRAERIKRCNEDPVFKAKFESDLAAKIANNPGLQDPPSQSSAPVFKSAHQTNQRFQPRPEASIVVLNMVDGNTSAPSSIAVAAPAITTASAPVNRGLAGSRWATPDNFVPRVETVASMSTAAPKNITPAVSSAIVPPHLRKPGATLMSGTSKSMEPIVSSGFVPFHLRVPAHQVANKVVSQGEKKDDAKKVILPRPVQGAAKPAPEPYILPHLRVPSSKIQPTLQPSPQASTSSKLPANLPSSSQGVILQTSTAMSLSTALPGPPAAAQIPASVDQNVALQFRAANMRNGVNVRKCDAMHFFRHGPNPIEPEYELYTRTPSDSSSGSSSRAPVNSQVQASASHTTVQAAPKFTVVASKVNTSPVANRANSSGAASSGQMSPDNFKKYIEDLKKDKAAQAVAPSISRSNSKNSSGKSVAKSTAPVPAPILPESTPVVPQGTAATSTKSDAPFTAAEISFMQTYVKPVRHPHQWKPDEMKELREYDRLMKIKNSQPRAPGIASIDEFMASRAKQGPVSTSYGAPKKKVTPPTSPKSKTRRSPKSKTPSPKIRRSPLSIDPFMNPAWNIASTQPGDFMAHVNARVPDGKSKKYSGKAINQAEKEDFMSVPRAGLQVWVDEFTTGDDAATEAPKKENIQPALKEKSILQQPVASDKGLEQKLPQKPVVDTSVTAFSSNEYLPPHLRVKQKLPQKVEASNAVASTTVVTLSTALPPHVEQKLPQKFVVKTPAASSTNGALPPHLQFKQKLPQKAEASNAVASTTVVTLSTALPPHVEQKLPQKFVVKTPAASSTNGALPPHLQFKQKLPQKAEASNAVASTTVVTLSTALPPHVEQKLPQKCVVETAVAASSTDGYLPPHLRAKQKLPQQVGVETTVAASSTNGYLPPHLQVKQKLPENVVVKISAAIDSSTALPPHLQVKQKLPEKVVIETSAAVNSLPALPPHLRIKQKLPLTAVNSSTALPPHLQVGVDFNRSDLKHNTSVPNSTSTNFYDPRGSVRSADDDGWGSVPPDIGMAQLNKSLAISNSDNNAVPNTSVPDSTSTNFYDPRGSVRSADDDGWGSVPPDIGMAQLNKSLAISNSDNNAVPNTSVPDSTSTSSKDPRGGVRSADDDGWGSVPPEICMAQLNKFLAIRNSINNAIPNTYVLPQLATSRNPPLNAPKNRELNSSSSKAPLISSSVNNAVTNTYALPQSVNSRNPLLDATKIRDLDSASFKAPAKDISPPIILPLHLRPNVAVRKPALPKGHTIVYPRPVTSPSPGFLPPNSATTSFGSSDPFCFDPSKVSDEGVMDKPKENIRATQGRSATDQLLDFDGSWLPPPQWDDRGEADYRYMGQYIKEWSSSVPPPCKVINTATPEFISGTFVVGDDKIISPPVHGPTLPVIQPEIEDKRIRQTANAESEVYTTALKAQNSNAYADAQANAEMLQKLREEDIEPDTFLPTMDLYLRPATTKDLAGIAQIYNYWVNNSIIPEDQKDVSEQDIGFVLQGCKANELPFLVAVKGKAPCNLDSQGRKLKRVASPQNETIIGFTFAQVQAFGFGSANTFKGRSRMNANLHLYVGHEFQKKGVGRNLLDRLLLTLYHAHSFRNGAEFVNPENDRRYGRVPERWNRVHFQVAVAKKDDDDFPRTSRFLTQSFFVESSRVVNGARTATKLGACRFADLATFSRVAVPDDVWGPHD